MCMLCVCLCNTGSCGFNYVEVADMEVLRWPQRLAKCSGHEVHLHRAAARAFLLDNVLDVSAIQSVVFWQTLYKQYGWVVGEHWLRPLTSTQRLTFSYLKARVPPQLRVVDTWIKKQGHSMSISCQTLMLHQFFVSFWALPVAQFSLDWFESAKLWNHLLHRLEIVRSLLWLLQSWRNCLRNRK